MAIEVWRRDIDGVNMHMIGMADDGEDAQLLQSCKDDCIAQKAAAQSYRVIVDDGTHRVINVTSEFVSEFED